MRKCFLSLVLVLAVCFGLTSPASAFFDTAKEGQAPTVSAGFDFSGFVDANGSLWMCGDNRSGQLGNGTQESSQTYIKIMDGVRSVSFGESHAAAIKTDGSLWMWGSNYSNALTGSVQEYVLTPKKVMEDVVAVSCGGDFTAAIKSDGSLWTWGSNSFGTLGNGTTESSAVPVKIMEDVVAVSCGREHAGAIKADGSLWTWGDNWMGVLGTGDKKGNVLKNSTSGMYCQTVPIKVMENVTALNCSYANTAVLKEDGSLWAWGWNSGGQLLNGSASSFQISATPTKLLDDVTWFSCGLDAIGAITTDGTLWTWGGNECGELGNGYTGTNYYTSGTPVQLKPVAIMEDVASVSCGRSIMYIVKKDGSIWGCGMSKWMGGNSNATNASGWLIQTVPVQISDAKVNPYASASVIKKVGGFNDVLETDYFSDAVLWAVGNGITTGTGASTFSPDTTCTKAQILTFLWRANGSPVPTISNPFSDIPTGAYYADAAVWAYEKGLISGVTFSGDTPATRADTVTYLWKLAGSPDASPANFSDVPANAEYAEAVAWAVKEGITSGTSQTTFSPGAACNRSQIVTFLFRSYSK